jgi:hypothetical protein
VVSLRGWAIRLAGAYAVCLGQARRGEIDRECGYRVELDMDTHVIAKGPGFPIGMLAERLLCPRCRADE